MPAYRYSCDRCHERMALAILVEVRPAVFVCTPCLQRDDAARDQWAAQTNTRPLDEATQRVLGIWHIEQRRQQHGGDMVTCNCVPADKCGYCGCCQHTPANAWCATSDAPRGSSCIERGCGCEGRA